VAFVNGSEDNDGAGKGKVIARYRVYQLQKTDEQEEVNVSTERTLHHCSLSKTTSKFT